MFQHDLGITVPFSIALTCHQHHIDIDIIIISALSRGFIYPL